MRIRLPRLASKRALKSARGYGGRFLLILAAAYVGSIVGAMIYGQALSLDWQDANPYGLVATVGLAVVTPLANLILLLALACSVAIVAFRLPIWTCLFVLILFAQVAYSLRSARNG